MGFSFSGTSQVLLCGQVLEAGQVLRHVDRRPHGVVGIREGEVAGGQAGESAGREDTGFTWDDMRWNNGDERLIDHFAGWNSRMSVPLHATERALNMSCKTASDIREKNR